jgi:hypothetical protein
LKERNEDGIAMCSVSIKKMKRPFSMAVRKTEIKKEVQFVCTVRRFIVAINNGK